MVVYTERHGGGGLKWRVLVVVEFNHGELIL